MFYSKVRSYSGHLTDNDRWEAFVFFTLLSLSICVSHSLCNCLSSEDRVWCLAEKTSSLFSLSLSFPSVVNYLNR